jgi:hypothetical protein
MRMTLLTLTIAAGLAVPAQATAAPLKVWSDDGLSDLRAKNVRCDTAKRVYRKSVSVAADMPGEVTRFKSVGLRWSCRAYNPRHRNGNPAWYEWKCRASQERLVHYRWKAGE